MELPKDQCGRVLEMELGRGFEKKESKDAVPAYDDTGFGFVSSIEFAITSGETKALRHK